MAIVDTDVHYTTTEAAEYLRLDTDTVRRYCANEAEGRTPSLKGKLIGRSWFIHPKELEKFSESRKQVGRPKK